MVRAISAFLEFCYLVRRSQLDNDTLDQIDAAITRYHLEREIFLESEVRNDFSLPRQHSISHYRFLIQQFGAPNGLCSSITESRHITAVKKPWRRSNRNEPLGQILLTNQRLDKLAMSRTDFEARGMLDGPLLTSGIHIEPPHVPPEPPRDARVDLGSEDNSGDAEAVEGITSMGDVKLAQSVGELISEHHINTLLTEPMLARRYPRTLDRLADYIGQARLEDIRKKQFLI
jgi:hypothetical protein